MRGRGRAGCYAVGMGYSSTPRVPGTFGQAEGALRLGPFLISETFHGQGLSVRPHEHASANVNFVLGGGYGEGFRGRTEVHLANTLLYKPAGARHSNRFDAAPARCLLIEADPGELALWFGEDLSTEPQVGLWPRQSLLATRAHHLLRERDDLSRLVLEELVTELFSVACRRPVAPTSRGVVETTDLLRCAFREPWSLRELAHRAGLHPAHLGRAFRKHHGCTVGEFVRHLRVLHVARRLRNTGVGVQQLALDAGFADQSHCTRVFSKLLGVSPARYRAELRSR